jgi:tRNA modification GTPase
MRRKERGAMTPPATIIALASGAGRAGVAVLRVSGPAARELCEVMTREPAPPDRRASLRTLWRDEAGGERLDDALVLYMPGPNSFTGEDVVELHVHGGPAIIAATLAAAQATGLVRLAEPGEFTRRAFENGRLDLTRAEAVADLVDAETEAQRRQAMRVYRGEMAERFEDWRALLIEAMAALEAAIDFPDEGDVPAAVAAAALPAIQTLEAELLRALAGFGAARAVREGFRIALLGAPNAGKSSLLNRLAGRDAAIVSPTPGTTRDVVEARVGMGGHVVWLADTAGLRDAADAVEAEGVRRARAQAESADLRLWVIDAANPGTDGADAAGAPAIRGGDLVVFNKIDLARRPALAPRDDMHFVSCLTGEGLDGLAARLEAVVAERMGALEAPLVTRARHARLVEETLTHLDLARDAALRSLSAEYVAEDLRLAARALGRVTGTVDVEDVLGQIFASFCIGK